MNRPRDVSVGVIPDPSGLLVWSAKFRVNGSYPATDKARALLEKRIAEVISTVDFGDLS
jgi:hypothetical protein